MDKYKVVGILNFFFGFIQVVFPLLTLVLVIPKLSALYTELDVEVSLVPAFLSSGLCLLVGGTNLFIGARLFSKEKKSRQKYFTIGLILAIGSFAFAGILTYLNALSAVMPIYSLTSQF